MTIRSVLFEEERETKNTVRFQEVVGRMEAPAIGVLYVQKSTLNEIGYTGGKLTLTLKAGE